MVESVNIKDYQGLREWLENHSREVSVWIVSRGAARVLPVWWQAVLTEDWARERGFAALPVLRNLLISSVAALVPTDNFRSSAKAASNASTAAFFDVSTAAPGAEYTAAHAYAAAANAAGNAANAAHATYDCAYAAADAARAVDASWPAVRTDAEFASGGTIPDTLSLWPEQQNPFEKEWSDIKTRVAEAPDAADWQFWLDWYDAQLAGRTMLSDPAQTRKMLEKIALIDPATWDAGPEIVNPKIREIWELHRLRSEVAALQAEKEAFLAARASEAQRRHNQPPDGLVDDQLEVARQITIVWDSLDEARDELEQDKPDKGRLREIANGLLSALTEIAKYCGKVASAGVLAAAVTFGGKVGSEFADQLIANGPLMQFAKDLLNYASGG